MVIRLKVPDSHSLNALGTKFGALVTRVKLLVSLCIHKQQLFSWWSVSLNAALNDYSWRPLTDCVWK